MNWRPGEWIGKADAFDWELRVSYRWRQESEDDGYEVQIQSVDAWCGDHHMYIPLAMLSDAYRLGLEADIADTIYDAQERAA